MPRYERHEQGETKDGILTEITKWQPGSNGNVKVGGVVGPFRKFKNGTVFENVTILTPCFFGNGAIFKKCKFIMITPFCTFGDGAVFDNCTIMGCILRKDAVISNSSIALSINSSKYINNKRETLGGPNEVTVESHHKRGTRIDSTHNDVTGLGGIQGYGNVEWKTNKSEDLPPQI